MTETANLQELRVHQAWTQLPLGARHHYTRSLLLDEVVSTNAIKGVFSTRRQIEEVLAEENKQSPTYRRAEPVDTSSAYGSASCSRLLQP